MQTKHWIIIQSRSSSKRLPAKSLLPINGSPLVLYCCNRIRIKNKLYLIVATSNDTSDDYLNYILCQNNIEVYRGSLDNVLSRFYEISIQKQMADNDVIIRLTADNPIVDWFFLNEMKIIYENNKFDYFSAQPILLEGKNWPFGLSAEFFKVKMLRRSFKEDESNYNKEHVTSYIQKIANNKKTMYDFIGFKENYRDVRTTIDTFEDYIKFTNLVLKYKIPNDLLYNNFIKFFEKHRNN